MCANEDKSSLMKKKKIKLDWNSTCCYGCASCMLACSFHHEKKFSPDASSISVFKDDKNGDITWNVDESCNQCEDEDVPYCIKFCPYDCIKEVKSHE